MTRPDQEQAVSKVPQNLTVVAGESAEFTCAVHPDLRKYIVWIASNSDGDLEYLANGTEVLRIENVTESTLPGPYRYYSG